MKNISIIISSILLSFLFSCGKKDNTPTQLTPTNLTVSGTPSTDNSGNVAFTASATNAVSYDYDFGNGVFQTVASGIVTYKYPASGTYTVNVVAKSSTGQTISKSTTITVVVALSLIWSDEFNTDGAPDATKWTYDLGAGGWGNNESEYYTNRSSNVFISNGTLKIVANKENYNGSAYTSARMKTQGLYSFKYGKIVINAKLPAGVGSWPALWMLGNNITTASWPACGEVDIMEMIGSQLNTIHGSLHDPNHYGANSNTGSTQVATSTTAFHKYGLEWNAATINFSVDDVVYYSYANTSSLPFNQNFFIILNLALGGNWGGAIDPAFSSATMEVDYVRVYQ